MLKTLVSNSGIGISSDNKYYSISDIESRILALSADDTNDTLTIDFKKSDNSIGSGADSIVLSVEDDKASVVAEDIINIINGLASNAQIAKVNDLLRKAAYVIGTDFGFSFDSDNASNDLELDPNAVDITTEKLTLYFEGMPASTNGWEYSAYVGSFDLSTDTIVYTATTAGTVNVDANGLFSLTLDGHYDAGGTDTILPATTALKINTVYVTVTNPYQNKSESYSVIITITNPAP